MDVIAGIGALPPGAGECDGVVGLVRRGIFAEADISVYPEDDVFEGKFRDGRVGGYDFLCEALDIAIPVLERAAVFLVAGCVGKGRCERTEIQW